MAQENNIELLNNMPFLVANHAMEVIIKIVIQNHVLLIVSGATGVLVTGLVVQGYKQE